ncbi:MAG: hypothetical protein IJ088_15755 [Clostridia bacterium]|nr:hypothetical protein [Clostridia bacterium]
MENLTELIRTEIRRQYGTVKEFSAQTGIPMSTLNTAFPKGIEGSSYELVTRICTILGIKSIYDEEITYVNREYYDLVRQLESLDDQGLATIKSLLTVETTRCKENAVVKAFNGVGHVTKSDERIKALIREVLEEQNSEK